MTIEIITWVLAALSITGTIMNIHKRRVCFYIWAVTNFSWMAYDFSIGSFAQSALFGVYFCLAIWGIAKWNETGSKE